MALILNIETSTKVCSVSLGLDGECVGLVESEIPQAHASQLTRLIEQLMADSNKELKELDAVAVSGGPGSYTGLRIGVSTAKGICYALNKPLIAVDTLKALAWAGMDKIGEEGFYVPMIDARRMEVYTATYAFQEKNPLEKTQARIIDESSRDLYMSLGKNFYLMGNGAEKCMDLLTYPNFQLLSLGCSAKHMVPLSQKQFIIGEFSDLAYYSPSYLKSPKITISKKKL